MTDFFKFVEIEKKPKARFVIIGDSYQIKKGKSFVEATTYIDKALISIEYELTEVIMNVEEKPVLTTALEIIKSIRAKNFNNLCINTIGDQLMVLADEKEERKRYYAKIFSESYNDSIFISYSNELVQKINQWGRKVFLKRTSNLPQVGDILELKNKITIGKESDVSYCYAGSYFQVDSNCSSPIVKSVPLKGRSQETIIYFREISVSDFQNAHIKTDKILFLEEFLLSDKPELDSDTFLALQVIAKQNIDNNLDYKKLKEEADQLKGEYRQNKSTDNEEKLREVKEKLAQKKRELLKSDPYLNAARFRYAYSTTGHQAQGRKWDAVLIDSSYNDQGRDNESYFRWLYTAITRTRHRVVLDKFKPITPWDKLQIKSNQVVITTSVKSLFYFDYPKERELVLTDLELTLPTGFIKTDLALVNLFLFSSIMLEKKFIKIVSVKQNAYQEQYTIESQQGKKAVLVFHYNGKFDITNLHLRETEGDVGDIALLTLKAPIFVDGQLANEIYLLIASIFSRENLSIEGVQSHNWLLMLTLSNSLQHRAIVHIYYDKSGSINILEIKKATSQEIVKQIIQVFTTSRESDS